MILSLFLNVLSVLILISSLIYLIVVRKWSKRELRRIENKKTEIEAIVESADQMIDELNRFSDYIIVHIAEKTHEVEEMLRQLDDNIEEKRQLMGVFSQSEGEESARETDESDNAEEGICTTVIPMLNKPVGRWSNRAYIYSKPAAKEVRPVEKIINSNTKSRQIVLLAEKGFDETEIAKRLNVGRGEIQLILGMKNGTTC